MPRYEVSIHAYGRPIVKRGPCQGLPDWPKHQWGRITPRPIGLESAKKLADAQDCHATVNVWQDAQVAYDNGKAPRLPEGWLPAAPANRE